MDFAFTPEQQQFFDSVYRFAKHDIAPHSEGFDARGEFSWDAFRKLARQGILGLAVPEEYGGSNAGVTMMCVAAEALGYAGVDAGTILSMGAHAILCTVPIALLGTEDQKRRYLPRLVSGEIVGGFGLTEPGSGSDAASVQTTAIKKGNHYVLNGTKMFITNGPIGDVFVVIAATDKEQKQLGISAFLVDKSCKGFSVGKILKKLGHRTSPTSELIFENCEVPAENLLGEEGLGFIQVAKTILEWERLCLLAPTIGLLRYTMENATRYAKERKQFGRPIADFQAVKRMLANMKITTEAARVLLYRACYLKEQGQPAMLEASMLKLFASEKALVAINDALQIHGGYGYMHEYPVEWAYRDAKLGTIGGGTSEVQRNIIAKVIFEG